MVSIFYLQMAAVDDIMCDPIKIYTNTKNILRFIDAPYIYFI